MLLHEVEAEAIKKALIFIKSQVQFYVQFIFYSDPKSVIENLKNRTKQPSVVADSQKLAWNYE